MNEIAAALVGGLLTGFGAMVIWRLQNREKRAAEKQAAYEAFIASAMMLLIRMRVLAPPPLALPAHIRRIQDAAIKGLEKVAAATSRLGFIASSAILERAKELGRALEEAASSSSGRRYDRELRRWEAILDAHLPDLAAMMQEEVERRPTRSRWKTTLRRRP